MGASASGMVGMAVRLVMGAVVSDSVVAPEGVYDLGFHGFWVVSLSGRDWSELGRNRGSLG